MTPARLVRPAAFVAGATLLYTFPQWSDGWESSRFATTVLRDILIFAILALSLDLLVGHAGLPSLGHAAFYGAGAYAAAIAGQRFATDDLLVGLASAIAVAALLALLIGFFAVRASGIFFLMLSLAFAQLVYAAAFQATDLTGGSNGFAGVRRPTFLGWDFSASASLYSLTVVVFLVVLAIVWRVTHSTYGRALSGLRENERRMRALGYDTRALKLSAFVLAGAVAGVAGALSAYAFRFVSPNDVALGRSIDAFVMVLIGGAGTLAGPVIGAGIVLYIDRVLSSAIGYSQTILGVVFILFVLLARQGIVGLSRAVYARAQRR